MTRKCGGLIRKHRHSGKEGSDLGAFSLNPIEDRFERRVAEATLNPFFLIRLISVAQSLRTIVEGVSEGFVDARQSVVASHKDLGYRILSVVVQDQTRGDADILSRMQSSMLGGVLQQRWVSSTSSEL